MEKTVRIICIAIPPILVLWAITILMIEWGQIKTLEEKVSWLEEQVMTLNGKQL